jgi:hypothetical protein
MHYGEVFERVVVRDERPPLDAAMLEPYALLMTRCWAADPLARPGFDSVLRCLEIMLKDAEEKEKEEGGGGEDGGGGGGGAAGRRSASLPGSTFIQDL